MLALRVQILRENDHSLRHGQHAGVIFEDEVLVVIHQFCQGEMVLDDLMGLLDQEGG